MTFCYLYMSDDNFIKSGVDTKVEGKVSIIKKMFPGSEIYYVSNAFSSKSTIKYKVSNSKYFKNENEFDNKIKAISKFIKENNQFTYFILRYPNASKALFKLVKENPNKIIFEHNTNELVELNISIAKLKKQFPFKISPSILKLHLQEIPRNLKAEKKLAPKILKLAKAGICVTPEIEQIQKFKFPNYETICIPNGIMNNKKNYKIINKENTEILNGVFLAGTNQIWNGIDRILNSYLKNKFDDKLHLYFVGKIDHSIFINCNNFINKSIYIKDYINHCDMPNFLEKMNFSIGTCGIHRKQLTQGSVLKVREYLANGLPVVIGHHDPYISSIPELKKYCLEFPADESLLDFEKIIDFVTKLYQNNRNLNSEIQLAAFEHLCWEKTLKPLQSID
jgi:hypothetical protein